jgi:hypothetical protein
MELWATKGPFTGSIAGGYQLGAYGVAPLPAGGSITNVNSGVLPYIPPPSGVWNVAVLLTEYTGGASNGGYTIRNWLTFPDTITGSGGSPPADTTPPTVSLSFPLGGNVSGTVAVSASANDDVGVTRVDFYVNGSVIASDTSSPWVYSWNTTALANGSATLRAVAYDAAGNSGSSSTITVNVANAPPPDTTPPTVSIASPAGGNVSGTVTVTASASDNVGVTRVDFYVNGSLAASDAAAPWTYSWNTTTLANGNATLRAVAYDAAGNSGLSSTVTVNVANVVAPPPDTTPPTVSIASPTGGSVSGTVTVTANASDNVGVTRVDFYVNGALAGTAGAAPYQYAWNTTSLANGSATLRAAAFDAAGNSAQSATVTVSVANAVAPPPPGPDVSPPVVTLLSPLGGTVSGIVTVTGSATDNVGVARVDLLVNGTVVASRTGAPWQFAWNSATVADGPGMLQLAAVDAAGNAATSTMVTVTVSNGSAPPPPAATTAYAIEFYNPALDHYFMTASAPEIALLDSGETAGWVRTGYTIETYVAGNGLGNPVCRFYMPPQYGNSHFYSGSPDECAEVAARFPGFVYESPEVFRIDTPTTDTGQCPYGDTPVYRLWNNRVDSNHRYTTSTAVRDLMIAKGYILEGYGPNPVIMCAPPAQ